MAPFVSNAPAADDDAEEAAPLSRLGSSALERAREAAVRRERGESELSSHSLDEMSERGASVDPLSGRLSEASSSNVRLRVPSLVNSNI